MQSYHDNEWGRPLHDDRSLFELLVLEGAQAGLSWRTVLHRRLGYRAAFEGFEIARVASYGDADRDRLVSDVRIIRNRAKIRSAISNARAVLRIQKERGSLDRFLWGFVGGTQRRNAFTRLSEIPPHTDESWAMSKGLKEYGCSFVGPTICYALMQSAGLVNDHVVECFRYDRCEPRTVSHGL